MTKIWRETGFVENDPWVIETDEVKATEEQKPLLGLDELIARADESNDVGLGVLIKPADDVRRLEPYLYRLEIVAVAFPAFNDGRAFSHASLLRQRLGYTNELRAVGDVLIDQVPLMLRVGIDSFSVSNATALKRLSENRLPAIPHHYQPAVRDADAGKGYSWRRQAKPAA
ncbi:DUF934 domain-containing protein [Rhizobium sophorae]|uniref:DUF934 domain-containing protein n=1 Tax=Rhizobium sophorae TaxID=1535242 RepID=A0A7Y3WCY7_9HYPH|nr:DUF934 domain-containing protein [Rhizobium sophorae]MBX4859114.1 DUF934 domain-containing protein [Rhizobium bangladeshense]NKK70194.1 DUF934 domain-containing protein [Rhizobium leguminosarum bv. viciae]NKL37597.1 DUF934 domain-containing protein [Rhizobium leguminosarum bv. viciae]NNU35830.1 DUF934 domain-containing protein [Rhizobium sophorae]